MTEQPGLFDDPESIEVAPIRPYAGTIGHAGSVTSERRAARQPAGKNQQTVLQALGLAGRTGVTVAEMRAHTGWHHGTASGCLSNLHKGGLVARLADERDGCQVYVLPHHVAGRTLAPHRPTKQGLAGRLLSCEVAGADGSVVYDGDYFYTAAGLLAALMEGVE